MAVKHHHQKRVLPDELGGAFCLALAKGFFIACFRREVRSSSAAPSAPDFV